MIYMLNIVYDPQTPSDRSPSKQKEHQRLGDEMRSKGHDLGGGGLAPVDIWIKHVQHLGDETVITDGPFAETREALGGFFLVDCSEEEALEYAGRIPVDNRSHIEVRQVWVYNDGKGTREAAGHPGSARRRLQCGANRCPPLGPPEADAGDFPGSQRELPLPISRDRLDVVLQQVAESRARAREGD